MLEDRGGWPARETVDAVIEFTEVVVARLGDRVGTGSRQQPSYADFETLERVPKDSFNWYRDFIAAHRAASA